MLKPPQGGGPWWRSTCLLSSEFSSASMLVPIRTGLQRAANETLCCSCRRGLGVHVHLHHLIIRWREYTRAVFELQPGGQLSGEIAIHVPSGNTREEVKALACRIDEQVRENMARSCDGCRSCDIINCVVRFELCGRCSAAVYPHDLPRFTGGVGEHIKNKKKKKKKKKKTTGKKPLKKKKKNAKKKKKKKTYKTKYK
eukprot:NODE_15118_length_1067_cov_3.273404.p2 GENE.NODE_15118_length_1067_cov_3.273404~~NODE_15118_length_1067_cov_3.273404.p2  ORF type:complete len:198 (-),score=67.03 NODE_15118_length_1067_cov_3.273404:24-617(-)